MLSIQIAMKNKRMRKNKEENDRFKNKFGYTGLSEIASGGWSINLIMI
jgi:hypothetical protein